jgi:hypothetical protein
VSLGAELVNAVPLIAVPIGFDLAFIELGRALPRRTGAAEVARRSWRRATS